MALDISAVVDGYEAGAGRTVAAGIGSAASDRWAQARSRLLAACCSGGTGADLLAAVQHLERDPGLPLAYGHGFGPEAPLSPGDELAAGDVLAVQARGWNRGSAGWYARDMILVGDREGELLTGAIPL